MGVPVATLEKLQVLEALCRSGYQSDVIQRTIDKLIALEQARVQNKLSDLTAHLETFEDRYEMSSDEFYRRYENGELGDAADFMEWSSFYDMAQSVQQHLNRLTGESC